MRQPSFTNKSIQALFPSSARVHGCQSEVFGSSGAPPGDVSPRIVKIQIATLEQKILELKVQLDGAAPKSDQWLSGYQTVCSAIATAYAAALIGPNQ
jgi:hypothetical protein